MSSGGYDPRQVEPEMYRLWEEGGYFCARVEPGRPPYVIMMPPPNVTGALHLGHALYTIQDLLIRYHRMRGENALWMPGTDHAGIATQAVVEKRLKQEQNLTRHELGREGLVAKIWAWKEEYNDRILGQLRRIGASCDWSRTRFTLDEVCAKAVYQAFFEFFKSGLIFRGPRLVNWDAALQTAVADDEIVHETVKGHLWHIRYPVAEAVAGDGAYITHLVVATTRPETMLGDTAVAVHPDDERYKHLIGRHCILPLVGRRIPIIADPVLVKKEFGTGCVKVTPAHDPNDYECARRHGLPMINILTNDGRINENGRTEAPGAVGWVGRSESHQSAPETRHEGTKVRATEERSRTSHERRWGVSDEALRAATGGRTFDYVGLPKEKARKQVVADLESLGLLEKVEDYVTEVGHSDRSKTPIEPLLSEQWFVRMDTLAELAMEAVRDGRVRFVPERYAKTYLDWLGEKRDWCISRQLYWGHRIPVWSKRMARAEYAEWVSTDRHASDLLGCDDQLCTRLDCDDGRSFLLGGPGYRWGEDERFIDDVGYEQPVTWRVCLLRADATFHADGRSIAAWLESNGFARDPDVLDTWFSSALWPFSTLGWPHDDKGPRDQGTRGPRDVATASPRSLDPSGSTREDFAYFFPTDVLCTGRGIITLWVARMVMTSLYFTGRVPFSHVYINPTILDGQGRIMSKSLGNGVDPLDIIDLYGTDALRFTLTQLAGETQDIRMPVKPVKLPDGRTVNSSEKFELGRNFCNKLWQAATGFIIPRAADVRIADWSALGPEKRHTSCPHRDGALFDKYIRARLQRCIATVTSSLDAFQFQRAADELRDFFWSEFCDWYLEEAKVRLTQPDANDAKIVMLQVLDVSLCLLHPTIPFITEAIWQKLSKEIPRHFELICGVDAPPPASTPPLIVAPWPKVWEAVDNEEWRQAVALALQPVICALRDIRAHVNAIRAQSGQPAIRTLPAAFVRARDTVLGQLLPNEAAIRRLGQVEQLTIGADVTKPAESATKVLTGVEVYVPLTGLADLDVERHRLRKEHTQIAGHAQRLEAKLSNAEFVAKAPAAVVDAERSRLVELREKLRAVESSLAEISG